MTRIVGLFILAMTLSGCSAIHGLTAGAGEFMADHMPEWAGGLPEDAPPRPDDPRYAKYMQEQNARASQDKQLTPAAGTQAPAVEGQGPR